MGTATKRTFFSVRGAGIAGNATALPPFRVGLLGASVLSWGTTAAVVLTAVCAIFCLRLAPTAQMQWTASSPSTARQLSITPPGTVSSLLHTY